MSSAAIETARIETAETEGAGRATSGRGTKVSWGRVAVVVALAQVLSGLVLTFHYRPTAATAYLDLVDLREVSYFGFVRPLHRWGSHALLVLVGMHLVRVALRGADTRLRRQAWPGGVVLMLAVVVLAATGSLLPWDQQALWGVEAGTPAAGGPAAGGPAAAGPARADGSLLRLYLVHCGVLPLLVVGLTVDHLRRARRD